MKQEGKVVNFLITGIRINGVASQVVDLNVCGALPPITISWLVNLLLCHAQVMNYNNFIQINIKTFLVKLVVILLEEKFIVLPS